MVSKFVYNLSTTQWYQIFILSRDLLSNYAMVVSRFSFDRLSFDTRLVLLVRLILLVVLVESDFTKFTNFEDSISFLSYITVCSYNLVFSIYLRYRSELV